MNQKHIGLVVVLIAVIGGIYFLQSMKAVPIPDDGLVLETDVVVAAAGPTDYIPDERAISSKKSKFTLAPELRGIAGYLNTDPNISIAGLKGKVVLVDFWTYTCINCIRTLPYLKGWHETYEDDGLVIIGVHTPEFTFEREYDNVKAAVDKNEISYAVVQDNDYRTWRAYENRYWPRKYLIDIDGFIRYDHIGEGGYAQTEDVIQDLLKERMERLGRAATIEDAKVSDTVDVTFGQINTPEIYFGYKFARGNFGNVEGYKPGKVVHYVLPDDRKENKAYIEGDWRNDEDGMELISERAKIILEYDAKVVNIVAGSENGTEIEILVDGKPVSSVDVVDGLLTVQEHKLYNVVDGETYGKHVLEIIVKEPGFQIFTFTFG